jgi:hypothetical protein
MPQGVVLVIPWRQVCTLFRRSSDLTILHYTSAEKYYQRRRRAFVGMVDLHAGFRVKWFAVL